MQVFGLGKGPGHLNVMVGGLVECGSFSPCDERSVLSRTILRAAGIYVPRSTVMEGHAMLLVCGCVVMRYVRLHRSSTPSYNERMS